MKHLHHIIPKHAGGTDDPANLIELTVEEHAEAHRILYEQHGRWQDKIAWLALSNQIGTEEIKRLRIEEMWKGKKHKPESIAKMKESCAKRYERQKENGTLAASNKKRSESAKGKKKSDQHMANWIESRKGHKVSQETRDKIRKTLAETRAKKKGLI